MPSLYDRTFGPTEEELRRAREPSFRMSSAGRRTPSPPAPGVPLKERVLGLGETAATVGSLVAGAVPAGVATMMALPFEGVRGAAKRGEAVSDALMYLPKSEPGKGALEALAGPMEAVSAPATSAAEAVLSRTGSPLAATVTEMALDPFNLLAAPAVPAAARGVKRAAQATGRAAKAAGRELGPKAAEMAESYMRRAGMMPDIFIGKSARTWDAASNARAVEMEKAGANPRDIWSQTGNWRAPDGQWRQEISDVGARFTPDPQAKIVSDVLSHPELFRAYPELRSMRMTMDPGGQSSYSAGFGVVPEEITLGRGATKKTALHEVQHPIQEREGFGAGANPEMFEYKFEQTPEQRAAFNAFANLSSKLGGPFDLRPSDISLSGDVYDFTQSIVDGLDFNTRLPKSEWEDLRRSAKAAGLKPPKNQEQLWLLGEDITNALNRETSKVDITPTQQYLRTPGEAEARAVEARAGMTAEQRRATFPEESYDVPISELRDVGRQGPTTALAQTDTPAFKEFTGGAPVIKADQATKAEFQTGKPVVIEGFSGTRRDFSEIDPAQSSAGYFLSSKPVVADEYAGVYPEGMGGGSFPTGGNIQRSFVRMDNPLFVNARGASFNRIDTRGIPGFGLPMSNTDMLNHWAKQQGYDGVIYKDLRDSLSRPGGQNAPASNVYVSFKPNYVKSAIGNRGTFDVQSRDMTKAQGGAVQGNSMGYSQTADMIAAKLMDQGVGRQQALQMALRMADAHMKAGGAVMMARGGRLAEGMKRAAAASREEQAKRAVEAAKKAEATKKARATKAEMESRQTAREAQGVAQPLTGALRPAVEPVRGRTSQELQAMQQQQLTPEQQELFSQMQQRYSGFGEASKFMTPQEVGKIISRPESVEAVSRLMSVLPTAENLAAVAKAGEPKRGWYRASAQAIMDVFGPQDAPRFTALLAAMSPQTSVEMNLLNTLNTWKNWTAAGRPTDPAQIRRVLGQSVSGTKGEQSVLEAWAQNSVRALATPDPLEITLSGPKVDSFYRNLADDVYRVTNDAWMASGLGVNQGLFSGAPTALQLSRGDPGLTPGYIGTSARMREAGQRAGILPSEAQETTWSFFMPLYEMQAKTGLPAREILQRGLLTPETIRGTPDFATLLNQGRYGDILKQAGYEQQLAGLKPSAFGLKARDLSLPEQREVESAARRLEGLREMRGTEKRSRAISLPSSQRPPRTAFAVEPHEYIPGSGVRLGESMVTAPLGTRQTYSSEISKLFRDPMERDRLQMAAGLKPLPTRAGTGSFRPPGGIPYQGRAGEPARTQRMPLETQPAFASVAEVPLTPSGQGVTKEAKDKLAAAAALRGYMTGQLGSTYNVQIPSKKGESMIVPLEKKADPDAMRYTYQYLDDAGFLADTGAGVNVLYNPYKPSNRPFSDVEMKEVSQLLGGKEVIPARTVSDYIDYSEAFGAPQGSGKATKQMLGYLDPLTPKQRAAMSAEAKDIAGSLYDLYTRKGEATGDEYRVDIMRALQILRDKGVPGLTAALAAGEALPAQEGALPR